MGGAVDFSGIVSGIDGGTAAVAIVAAAAVLALVGFASWGAKKVGRFFDDRAFWSDRYYDHQVDAMKDGQKPMTLSAFKRSGRITDTRGSRNN